MKNYTHKDESGMRWRFEGSRPISALADEVLEQNKILKKLPKKPSKLKKLKK